VINDNIDRDQVVQHLAMLLTTNLKGTDNLVVDVFDYIPVNPNGISPFLAVAPLGSNRSGEMKQGSFLIIVYIYVLYAMDDQVVGERESWSTLSQVEKGVAETLKANNRADGYWNSINWAEYSQANVLPVDNQGYLIEAIPLEIQAY
jgi:hypothetical protein